MYVNVLSAEDAASTTSPYFLASANAFFAHWPVMM
jgi:hypothetical protein